MDAKLTAYALNELPPAERADFEAQMKSDPALQEQAEEMKAFCTLLADEVAQNADDTLMPAQRAQLVQGFHSARNIIRPPWRRPVFLSSLGLAAAACVAVMLTIQHAKQPAEMTVTLAQAPLSDEFHKDRVSRLKDADQSLASRVAVQAVAAEKKEASMAALPVTSPAVPAPAPIDGLIAIAAAPMPTPAYQPEFAAAGQKSSPLNAGAAIQIPQRAMDLGKSVPAVQLAGDATLKNLPQNPIANTGGLAQAGSGPNLSTAAPTYGGINGARDDIFAISSPQAGNLPMNGGGLMINGPTPSPQAGQFYFKNNVSGNTIDSSGGGATDKAGTGTLVITGGGTTTLSKSGGGSLTLTGSNAYSGATTINAGEIRVGQGVSGTAIPGENTPVTFGTSSLNRTSGMDAPAKNRYLAEQPVPATVGGRLTVSGAVSGTSGTTPVPGSSGKAALHATIPTPVASDAAGFVGLLTVTDPEPKQMREIGDLPERLPALRQLDSDNERLLEKSKTSNTATYRPIIENPFTFVAQQPLSTFSLDVDTAAYANVRRLLNSGQRPPPDAVRLEELVNYFSYRYEGPAADRPIAVHVDLADAPWQPLHRIARVAVKAREVKGERPAANFVFLLDVSGSMEPNERLPLIKQSLRLLVEQLREDDRVAIVTYAGESGVALESTTGTQKEKIQQAIQKLKSGGSTNGASGIRLAYEQAALNFQKDRINRVILCTDGDFNVGTSNVQELEKIIAEKAKGGVFLSVLGVGTDNLHDHTMQALADRGNGNYHYLDSVGEARKVLVEQMTGTLVTVAKDVKLQIEFNPAQVAAYRLIGYEKRLLAKEDFNNDKKDAGEIGAGHTVTALYEIVPASLKYPDGKPLVDELKYALAPSSRAEAASAAPAEPAAKPAAASATKETMTVKVRYKEPNEDQSKLFEVAVSDGHKKLSESDRDFQFAVSVAGFGMLLRGSPNAAELTWDGVRRLALAGKGDDEQGWRGEFIQLIEKARGLCGEPR